MKRRDLLKFGSAAVLGGMAGARISAQSQAPAMPPMPAQNPLTVGTPGQAAPADYTLRIAPVALEIAPSRFISTIGYNGTSPGPVLRMREGKPVSVDVINDTDAAELVHWHGLFVPSDVDGANEEGTPMVPPGERRRYQFTPKPAGTRWYHSHAMAGGDLHRGSYTGQYGFLMVEAGNEPGQHDLELFLALRDWEPFFTDQMENEAAESGGFGPPLERPAQLDTRPNGLEVTSQLFSINDKALGAGEPIRVRAGQRALIHLLNASAIEIRTIAFSGHQFRVIAMDGNPVPSPKPVDVLMLGPGERIDAYVEMNQPGVWILGSTDDPTRNAGLGVIVEYENQHSEPRWIPPAKPLWDYTTFGTSGAPGRPAPDRTIDMVFEKIPSGAGQFNLWQVNGKPYPHDREFVLQQGARYRLIFRNRTDDSHPVHLHRHLFELVDVNGKPTAGLMKDTVIVPVYGRVSADLVADQPGLSLFHCHIQQHMDYGFKALFRYA
ncbi:MAG TPA: multicopper oxidase domain-containing protein [Candidatus Acidoferrales bacterium]|nr:multicopper oxidase domain-containing protein [Candidatus Acidoferrales bacterium]